MSQLLQIAVAALVHDLPMVFERLGQVDLNVLSELIQPAKDPRVSAILNVSEKLATPEGIVNPIVRGPLLSIFPKVRLAPASTAEPLHHLFAPLPTTVENPEVIFGTNSDVLGNELKYLQDFYNDFSALRKTLDFSNTTIVYHHLLALLERYAWCLPSHTDEISLYDHARLTSAIAVCIYLYHQNNLTPEAIQASVENDIFSLIVGDLSGIQDYIFDIANIGAGGVARRLRARSFYIAAVSDVISHIIANQFQVPFGNIIMASGGKFYILVPNLKDSHDTLHHLRHEIDSWFRTEFNGEMAVNLARTSFAGALFHVGSQKKAGFGQVLTTLSLRLNREKRQRGHSVLSKDGQWATEHFMAHPDFWGSEICISCRKFPGNQRESLCEKCARDEDIGQKLPRVRYLAYYRGSLHHPAAMPMPLDYSVRIFAEDELSQIGQPYLLGQLNDPRIQNLAAYPATFRYLANYVPVGKHGQKSFEDIAKAATGRSMLGYIKADVDYLGILFAQGLKRDQGGYDTAVHLSSLSRQLDLFFSGWMQYALSKGDFNNFYTIFSGGDDLFLVGPWDKAVELAQLINKKLAEFVGNNPDITLSTGILFTKDRYPIYRAASDAESVLETSKEERNRLSVLGDTLKWDDVPKIFAEIEILQRRSEQLKSSFLYHLITYGQLYRDWKYREDITGLRYKPMFAYNIARNLRKGDTELYHWADTLLQSLHGNPDNLTMEHLGLIATYVLFSRRAA